jgi:ParB family chromosome partitioning protein
MATALEKMRKSVGAKADESIGATRVKLSADAKGPPSPPPSGRLKGLSRLADAAVIPIHRIVADPDQPRKEFDEEALGRLAENLKASGQLQPIRVRYVEEVDHYVILCGERRWRAAMIAEMASLACIVHDGAIEPIEVLAIQLAENCAREDLGPIDQAEAYRKLMALTKWSGRQLAREVGVSQSTVSRALALLDLAEPVLDAVALGDLSPSVAYELTRIADAVEQVDAANRVMSCQMSRAQAAREVDRVIHRASSTFADPSPAETPGVIHGASSKVADPTPVVPPGVIHGASSKVAKALPDWRDRPVMGLGLDRDLVKLLADEGIESAGEAWGLLSTGFLREDRHWSYLDAKRLELALVKVREEAGDPDPLVIAMKPDAPSHPKGEGRDIPVAFPNRPESPPIEGGRVRPNSYPAWRKADFSGTDEVVVSNISCMEGVIRSSLGPRPLIEQLIVARDMVAAIERELEIRGSE